MLVYQRVSLGAPTPTTQLLHKLHNGTWPCLRRPSRQRLGTDLAHEAVEGAVEGAVGAVHGRDREAPQQQILPANLMGWSPKGI